MRAYDPRRNAKRTPPTPFATLPLTIVSGFTMIAFAVALVGIVGVKANWADGARLLYFSGGVLVLNGLWCAYFPSTSQRIWGAARGGVGLIVAAIGLAMLGGALEHDFGSAPCLLLMAPFGVSIIRLGIWMHRRPSTDDYEPLPALFALGFALLGLGVIALGLLDLLR